MLLLILSTLYITRHGGDVVDVPKPEVCKHPTYPWTVNSRLTPITKEHFRCNGSALNPPKKTYDCDGSAAHSLPIVDGHEHIYPVLIKLLNYIQETTKCPVVITYGHRCLDHHLYAKLPHQNRTSKSMLGAEVAFYVQGMEEEPSAIIEILRKYYDEPFQRYDNKTDVSTKPWFNKEIFVKLYKNHEGRDGDNRHPYPYVVIQVRHDGNLNKRVLFNWETAQNNTQIY